MIWRERAGFARKAGITDAKLRRIAQGPSAPGWEAFEANPLRMADQLFRNSFVNDAVFNALAARYDACHLMDAGMTVSDVAAIAFLCNNLGAASGRERSTSRQSWVSVSPAR